MSDEENEKDILKIANFQQSVLIARSKVDKSSDTLLSEKVRQKIKSGENEGKIEKKSLLNSTLSGVKKIIKDGSREKKKSCENAPKQCPLNENNMQHPDSSIKSGTSDKENTKSSRQTSPREKEVSPSSRAPDQKKRKCSGSTKTLDKLKDSRRILPDSNVKSKAADLEKHAEKDLSESVKQSRAYDPELQKLANQMLSEQQGVTLSPVQSKMSYGMSRYAKPQKLDKELIADNLSQFPIPDEIAYHIPPRQNISDFSNAEEILPPMAMPPGMSSGSNCSAITSLPFRPPGLSQSQFQIHGSRQSSVLPPGMESQHYQNQIRSYDQNCQPPGICPQENDRVQPSLLPPPGLPIPNQLLTNQSQISAHVGPLESLDFIPLIPQTSNHRSETIRSSIECQQYNTNLYSEKNEKCNQFRRNDHNSSNLSRSNVAENHPTARTFSDSHIEQQLRDSSRSQNKEIQPPTNRLSVSYSLECFKSESPDSSPSSKNNLDPSPKVKKKTFIGKHPSMMGKRNTFKPVIQSNLCSDTDSDGEVNRYMENFNQHRSKPRDNKSCLNNRSNGFRESGGISMGIIPTFNQLTESNSPIHLYNEVDEHPDFSVSI